MLLVHVRYSTIILYINFEFMLGIQFLLVMLVFMTMIHLNYIHFITPVGIYVVLISFTLCHDRCCKMVGKGRKHSAAASSPAGDGMGTSIPASPLRRVLLSTMQGAAPVIGGRPPAKPRGTKGTRCIHVGIYVVLMLYAYWYLYTFYYSCWYLCCTKGTRGRGRGRAVAATPSEVEATRSPPPPQADSPEHRTSRMDSYEVEATRSPVHEPRVDVPQVDEPSTHETRVLEASF